MENTVNTNTQFPNRPPKTWLVESILVTLFCCPFIFGLIGIIYSTKVESYYYAGLTEAAEQASRTAGRWTKAGFWTGISLAFISVIVWIIMFTIGALASLPGIF